MMMLNHTVHLMASWATLLSGGVDDCMSANETSCVGGISAVSAFARNLSDPYLVIQRADLASPFVQMHPLGWGVNEAVINGIFEWDVFSSSVSLLVNDVIASRDLSSLQTVEMPFLISNVAVPPSNSWFPYTKAIHFDNETRLAVISLVVANQDISRPLDETAMGLLDYIARINSEAMATGDPKWTSVVYNADLHPATFLNLVDTLSNYTNPPDLLLDIEDNAPELYGNPTLIGKTWVSSYRQQTRRLHRFAIARDENFNVVQVGLVEHDLGSLPSELKDETYSANIDALSELAQDAALNNPIVGYTGFVPVTRDSGNLRRCMGGECPIGNLFTDALRWYTNADLAFISSGGVRGPGWDEGPVRVSDIWSGLPFANNVCTGTMSGISLFKLLNHSTSLATYQSTYTPDGDNLFQVSGVRYSYNTLLKTSRLVGIEIWDQETETYQPVERLRLYSFATDSFLCGIFAPYNTILTSLSIEGEQPGVIDTESLIHQFIVAEYLSATTSPTNLYDSSIEGRLANLTEVTDTLNLVQTEDSCPANTAWSSDIQTCIECPETGGNVAFSDPRLEFVSQSNGFEVQSGRIVLSNRETFTVVIRPTAVPQWIQLENIDFGTSITLLAGESIAITFKVGAPTLEPGSALGTVSFGVLDVGLFAGCVGKDASFDILVRITPPENKNQLGSIRYVGLSFMGLILLFCIVLASLVVLKRKERVVKTFQPPFLLQLCGGVGVMALAILPFSVDDGTGASALVLDICCMSFPWFLSMGFTISFAALFSKLWRINRLFQETKAFKRVEIMAKDVLLPFFVLFFLNLVFLLVWSLLDPLRWRRLPVPDQLSNTFGTCQGSGAISTAMLGLTVSVNAAALLLACYQAYRARSIGDEFSESKYLGISLFSWFQVMVVGCPVLFLIDQDDPTTRYFLVVGFILVLSVSMLLLVFLPLFMHYRKPKAAAATEGTRRCSTSVAEIRKRSTEEEKPDAPHIIQRNALMDRISKMDANISQLRDEKSTLEQRNNELEKMLDSMSTSFGDWISSKTSCGESFAHNSLRPCEDQPLDPLHFSVGDLECQHNPTSSSEMEYNCEQVGKLPSVERQSSVRNSKNKLLRALSSTFGSIRHLDLGGKRNSSKERNSLKE